MQERFAVHRRHGLHGAVAALVGAAAALVLLAAGASPAAAVPGYSTSGAVNVRAAASTSAGIVGSIPARRAIDIECQTSGTNVSGSTVWDKVPASGGYISDFFVNGTPYGVFDGRIPRCGGVPAAPPSGLSTVTSAQVNARSAPSFNATQTGSFGAGAAITISCQSYGTKVNGSFIWDKVGASWVSDFFVNGTPFNAFDTRLPRCSPAYSPVDCDKVLFLGARGSGEPLGPRNMGDGGPVDTTFQKLAALGANLDADGVIYQAQSVDLLWTGQQGAYLSGESQGVDVLLGDLRRRTDGNVCGWQNTRAVLVGYSQGAMVVSEAIDRMTPQERSTIKGVVTYGNPYHSPGVNGDYLGGGPGILGPRAPFADGVDRRARDICLNDLVCARNASRAGYDAHLKYVEWGWTDDGARFLRDRL